MLSSSDHSRWFHWPLIVATAGSHNAEGEAFSFAQPRITSELLFCASLFASQWHTYNANPRLHSGILLAARGLRARRHRNLSEWAPQAFLFMAVEPMLVWWAQSYAAPRWCDGKWTRNVGSFVQLFNFMCHDCGDCWMMMYVVGFFF